MAERRQECEDMVEECWNSTRPVCRQVEAELCGAPVKEVSSPPSPHLTHWALMVPINE